MKKPMTIAMTLLTAFAGLRCTPDATGPDRAALETPPHLPPLASMQIAGLESDSEAALGKSSGGNHARAALTVGFWTGVAAVHLAAPTALFALAHKAEPAALPGGEGWQWTVGNAEHSATLTAVGEGGNVRWSMAVTGGQLEDFVWYTGTARLDGEVGAWTFNDPADGSAHYSLTYDFNSLGGEVKAEVVDADAENKGSYLKWRRNGDVRAFEGYDAAKDESVVVLWNRSTGAGELSIPKTGERLCWDGRNAGHRDVDCAPQAN